MLASVSNAFPSSVARLFWEIDPASVDLREHRDYVLERLMARGGWDVMRWLRTTYSREDIADFLARKGHRLAPRELAYWTLIASNDIPQQTERRGGGRPSWAGP
jgi:hypothetical protein